MCNINTNDMDVFFKVIDKSERFVGFIKDPLLNLSSTPDNVIRQSVSSKSQLLSCTKGYQNSLDNLLKMSNAELNPLSRITNKIYNKHFSKYKLGDLKVITAPTNKYL